MTADEFVKIARGGSDKLRVDSIILTFGGQEFHGSGTMQIEQGEIKLVVHLNGEEKFPDPKVGIHTKRDTWQLKGVIEYHLEFRCDRAMVVSPRDMFGKWQTFGLNPVYLIHSGLDAMSSHERHAFFTQGESESQPIVNEDNSVCFTALLQEYPFFEPLCGKKWEGEIEGFNFTLEKENDAADLHVILNSKQDYASAGETEDENKFQAFMSALAFLTGANAWPYRIEHRRGRRKISDMIRATGRLSRISHTPFSNGLAFDAVVGNKNWNFQDVLKKGTAFFEANSKLSKEISNLLFLFREADAKEVHSDITMISLCALFENLVQLLFRELKLEEETKNSDGTYKDTVLQFFIQAKEKLKAQINQQIDLASTTIEGEGWKRMSGAVGSAAPFTIREKFQAVLKHFQLDEQWRKEMENSFKTWHAVRQHLFHYKDRTSQSEDDLKKAILDQCQIAGTINFLILKLIGYSGLMRANSFWGDYR